MNVNTNIGDYSFNVRVNGVIIEDGKVLCHKRKTDSHYALIGKKVKIGENSEDTIIRAFREVLDKEVKVTYLLATIENFYTRNGKKFHEIIFVYRLDVDKDEKSSLLTSVTKRDFEWVKVTDIYNINIQPSVMKELFSKDSYPVHIIANNIK